MDKRTRIQYEGTIKRLNEVKHVTSPPQTILSSVYVPWLILQLSNIGTMLAEHLRRWTNIVRPLCRRMSILVSRSHLRRWKVTGHAARCHANQEDNYQFHLPWWGLLDYDLAGFMTEARSGLLWRRRARRTVTAALVRLAVGMRELDHLGPECVRISYSMS